MKTLFCFFLLISFFQTLQGKDGYKRNTNADVLHYEFSLEVNDSTNRIVGRTIITVRFLNSADSICFDLKGADSNGMGMLVRSVSVSSEKVKWDHNGDQLDIWLSSTARENDTLQFVIEYSGVPADGLIISKNKFGNRTFFADHWPNRAHNYLPCIDHPYDKASVDFIIKSPDRYRVVANGLLIEESDLKENMTLTHWREMVPLATKVMAFGIAEFAVQNAGSVNDILVWSWVYPENRSEGFSDYAIAVEPLGYYSSMIAPYPYKKLANVQSKTIYGGLENAGTIFYAENSVTGEGKAERLIAHEISHQWFGNSVTEADWHHIWLSEGFATYLTSLYFEGKQGKDRLKYDMELSRTRVVKYFERNARPVIDTAVVNLMDLLNANSYQKGAWVLHMLRNEIGDELFFEGLRLYYDRFKSSNALTEDFRDVMSEVSGRNLDKFFQQWLYTAGQPEVSIRHKVNKRKGTTEIFIEQGQEPLFEFNLDLLIDDLSGKKIISVKIDKRVTNIALSSASVIKITPDPDVKLLFRQP
jgi:aminopeptidase N